MIVVSCFWFSKHSSTGFKDVMRTESVPNEVAAYEFLDSVAREAFVGGMKPGVISPEFLQAFNDSPWDLFVERICPDNDIFVGQSVTTVIQPVIGLVTADMEGIFDASDYESDDFDLSDDDLFALISKDWCASDVYAECGDRLNMLVADGVIPTKDSKRVA